MPTKAKAKPAKKAAPKKSAPKKAEPPLKPEAEKQVCGSCVKMIGLKTVGTEPVEFREDKKRYCDQCGLPKFTADRKLFK